MKRVERVELSWPEILPSLGRSADREAQAKYDRIVDGLIAEGAEVVLVLNGDDVPWRWETMRGGWSTRDVANAFVTYAYRMMMHFADRVTNWEIRATVADELADLSMEDLHGLSPENPAHKDPCEAYHKLLAMVRAVVFARALPQDLHVRMVFWTHEGMRGGFVDTLLSIMKRGKVPTNVVTYAKGADGRFTVVSEDVCDFACGRPDVLEPAPASAARRTERPRWRLFPQWAKLGA